ncbi:MAG: HU family DNA-binding protein [Hydrogenothermaceae bacterium]|nr:HU family DNA-binding protein [Hydrogenothermaceae bacterium]
MKRADIVDRIVKSGKVNLNRKEISNIVDSTFDIISSYLSTEIVEGKKVMISGFGSFIIKKRKPKLGRNPKTREEKLIPERFGISFKTGKILKRKINGK